MKNKTKVIAVATIYAVFCFSTCEVIGHYIGVWQEALTIPIWAIGGAVLGHICAEKWP